MVLINYLQFIDTSVPDAEHAILVNQIVVFDNVLQHMSIYDLPEM